MKLTLDPNSIEDYRKFLKIKGLPTYRFSGREAYIPDEYAGMMIGAAAVIDSGEYSPWPGMFDYQAGIAKIATRKRKFCVFAEPGLGKTFIMGECVRHALPRLRGKRALIVSPLMVVDQTLAEFAKFYSDLLQVRKLTAANLQAFLDGEGDEQIGIVNFEAIKEELTQGQLGLLAIDESSMMKSHYGKWGTKLIELGKGLEWKYCFTGTPAPNDRIEYANHAVFMDAFPNVNSFLAKFFVNRGQTNERWELRPHALKPFYRALSHWSIFLVNPATYGWKDNSGTLPPINVHIHDVELTPEQVALTMKTSGKLIATELGGISSRASYGQIAKGHYKGQDIPTNKPEFIRSLVESWPDESTIIWCIYNEEQRRIAATFPEAVDIDGDTPLSKRLEGIAEYKARERRTLISKSKILGFGLNLQVTTRMVFSGLQDSYEGYWQCVKRANRVGSTLPLNVHIPITDIERPMVETVLRKAKRVQQDTEEQESIFKESGVVL